MKENSILIHPTPLDAGTDFEVGQSRLFGAPDVPEAWLDGEFAEGEIFLCQVRCADIAGQDVDGRFPKEGWLYFFLDISGEEYIPYVRYFGGAESELCRVDFNEDIGEPYDVLSGYTLTFSSTVEDEEKDDVAGCKLAGFPARLENACLGSRYRLLFQYDTKAHPKLNFLAHRARFLYFVMDEAALAAKNFEEVYIYREED